MTEASIIDAVKGSINGAPQTGLNGSLPDADKAFNLNNRSEMLGDIGSLFDKARNGGGTMNVAAVDGQQTQEDANGTEANKHADDGGEGEDAAGEESAEDDSQGAEAKDDDGEDEKPKSLLDRIKEIEDEESTDGDEADETSNKQNVLIIKAENGEDVEIDESVVRGMAEWRVPAEEWAAFNRLWTEDPSEAIKTAVNVLNEAHGTQYALQTETPDVIEPFFDEAMETNYWKMREDALFNKVVKERLKVDSLDEDDVQSRLLIDGIVERALEKERNEYENKKAKHYEQAKSANGAKSSKQEPNDKASRELAQLKYQIQQRQQQMDKANREGMILAEKFADKVGVPADDKVMRVGLLGAAAAIKKHLSTPDGKNGLGPFTEFFKSMATYIDNNAQHKSIKAAQSKPAPIAKKDSTTSGKPETKETPNLNSKAFKDDLLKLAVSATTGGGIPVQ